MKAKFSSLIVIAALAGAAMPAFAERVRIGSFAIDATEVTIGAFAAFATATNRRTAAEIAGGGKEYSGGWVQRAGWTFRTPFGKPGAANEPAVQITWAEARDFCMHQGGRLPSIIEWRQAAYTESRDAPSDGFVRGRTYEFPVGATPEGMNNNRERHLPVGTTKRGVNGLYDMGANVWEWIADRRGDDALTAGGSWWYGAEQTRAGAAQWKAADFTALYIGFRCAYDLPK
jgi:formylglycine-generating enzyme